MRCALATSCVRSWFARCEFATLRSRPCCRVPRCCESCIWLGSRKSSDRSPVRWTHACTASQLGALFAAFAGRQLEFKDHGPDSRHAHIARSQAQRANRLFLARIPGANALGTVRRALAPMRILFTDSARLAHCTRCSQNLRLPILGYRRAAALPAHDAHVRALRKSLAAVATYCPWLGIASRIRLEPAIWLVT
ncbi:hypothetical protein D9M68_581740 [compost metagenome]